MIFLALPLHDCLEELERTIQTSLKDALVAQDSISKSGKIPFRGPDICTCHYTVLGPRFVFSIDGFPSKLETFLHVSCAARVVISA